MTIPPIPSAPTGQVFNLNNASGAFNSARFLFDSEDGVISGWNGGSAANVEVDNSASGAVYKGLAIQNGTKPDNSDSFLYATNFNSGEVEMYSSSFGLVKSFTDTSLPDGYAPFNDKVIGGELYVTYALQDGDRHDDVAGPGHGFVDVFSLDGTFDKRLISNGALDSPWGMEIAPSSFGQFADDLLVGNFGDGKINAYNATTGDFIGTLEGANGDALVIDGLWALTIGNGGAGGSLNTLYFTAGLNGESDGLFGALTAIPEPSTWAMMLLGFAGLGFAGCRHRAKALQATA